MAASPEVVETAAALLIGAELLSGKVRDANLHELAGTLRGLGIDLVRVVVVTDDLEVIASELDDLRSRYGAVFTSGGVGPTHDDVTVRAAARSFGVPLVHNREVEQLMRRVYDTLTEEHLRMARIPEGSELLYAASSPWPAVRLGRVWLLPGIPEVFRAKLEIVRHHLRGPGQFYTRDVFCKSDEADLCLALETVVAEFPAVAVGSYPKWGEASYRTHITFDGRSEAAVERCRERFLELVEPTQVVSAE